MNTRKINVSFIVILVLILIAASLRLVIKIPNFNPVGAMALFGGTYIVRKSLAFIIPVIIMLLSDLFLGFYDIEVMVAVYLSFILVVGLGIYLRNHLSIGSVIAAGIAASILFYLITNFAVWISGFVGYPMNFTGLLEAYIAGLQFLRNFFAGTMTFSLVLYGGYYILQQFFPVLFEARY